MAADVRDDSAVLANLSRIRHRHQKKDGPSSQIDGPAVDAVPRGARAGSTHHRSAQFAAGFPQHYSLERF